MFSVILVFCLFSCLNSVLCNATEGVPENHPVTEGVVSRHVAVVCPLAFQKSLQPWIQYREQQGYVIHLMTEPEPVRRADGRLDQGILMELPADTPNRIRRKIRELAEKVPLCAILLVGDGVPLPDTPYQWRDIIPAARVPAHVIQHFDPENNIDHIASDSWYADLDDDNLPDVAIGRFPVRDTKQLDNIIQKTIRYETVTPAGLWQRKINLIAGIGGFSPIVDHVIESTVRNMLADLLPDAFDVSLTYANWRSPYCPWPDDFSETILQRINEGSLFTAYFGHGYHRGLDRLETPNEIAVSGSDNITGSGNGSEVDNLTDGFDPKEESDLWFVRDDNRYYKILEFEDVDRLVCSSGPPVLLFFACYTGAFDANEDSLAEQIARTKNGPVAVLAASRTSMPYGMAALGIGLLNEAFEKEPDTLGTMLLLAKRDLILADFTKDAAGESGSGSTKPEVKPTQSTEIETTEPAETKATAEEKQKTREETGDLSKEDRIQKIRYSLNQVAKVFDPTARKLPEQRVDHLHLFNLFGDPLLRLAIPKQIDIEVPELVYSDQPITISGELPGSTSDGNSGSMTEDAFEWTVRVELAVNRKNSPVPRKSRQVFDISRSQKEEWEKMYQAINQTVLASLETRAAQGHFSVELPVPKGRTGAMTVRVILLNDRECRFGSRHITVRPRSFSDVLSPSQ